MHQSFPVVGIGASAGGLEAYKHLLRAIPSDSPIAYILVQHLDPTHESMLPEILARHASLPVHEITDNINLVPGHIYIIPSNRMLLAVDGVLKLKQRPKRPGQVKPIDIFFNSLADVHKEQAVGIILSGTGTDGTLGLLAIKEAGGITFAQEPTSAAYDGMPQSAIDANAVDFILSPEKMPDQLRQINFKPLLQSSGEQETSSESQNEEIYRQIVSLLRLRRLVDFTYYKKNTIKRRIARRMAITNTHKDIDYLKFLKTDNAELDALFEDLLIPVSSFFRDEKPFEKLKDKVFPIITKDKTGIEPIRIWIAGCSNGEEAYSIAIALYEYLGDAASRMRIQIFGTDISEKAIATARAGIYSQKQLEDSPPRRLQKYFTKHDGNYQVAKFIRDMCVFATHNFLKDPPFARLDLVSCRNVLIYLEPFLQKRALSIFHYALKEKRFLLLGKSETTGSASDLFAVTEKYEKIYLKRNVVNSFAHNGIEQRTRNVKEEMTSPALNNLRSDFQKSADDILLQEYTPVGVVVNEHSDIVHFRGDTGVYLTPSPGKPTLNLFKMARHGLSFELRNAMHKAKNTREATSREAIPLQFNGEKKLVSIKIIPLPNTIEPYYLVLFQENHTNPSKGKRKTSGAAGKAEKNEEQLRIQQLERELAQSREDMKSITEVQEAANEELQSANEELLSSSEELQSVNEELETTKEELQSANEELTIVNHELLERNNIITDARKYSDAIIATIRQPLLILNKDLRIRTANKSFYNTFGVSETETEEKLLYELGNHQWDIAELRKLLHNISPDKPAVSDFEVTHNFPDIGKRTMLLNARLIKSDINKERLILLAIEDITERKLAQDKLSQLNKELDSKVKERTILLNDANINLSNSNKDLMQFAHVASHDLKEPLRKITTYTNRLKDDSETNMSEKSNIYLQKVQSAAARMTTMIEGVLAYSMTNVSENLVDKIDLNRVMKNIQDDLELLIQKKEASIQYNRLPEIEGAEVLIYQLFYNLVNNALKFSQEGKEQVIFINSVIVRRQERDFAKITVSDRGIGFEQGHAEEIFETFTRLHPKDKYEGTGLGLTLCKKIAERHGGTITAEGAKNEGATFTVLLPLKQMVNHI